MTALRPREPAREVRADPGPVPGLRRPARRPERQPAVHPRRGREDRHQVDRRVRLAREPGQPGRRGQGQGGRRAARAPGQRAAQPPAHHAASATCPTQIVGATPADLRPAPWDRDKIHQLFDTLQFRVLRDRLYQTLPRRPARRDRPAGPARRRPAPAPRRQRGSRSTRPSSARTRSPPGWPSIVGRTGGACSRRHLGPRHGQRDRHRDRRPGRRGRVPRPDRADRRTTSAPWPPGWPSETAPRRCTTPRDPCTRWRRTASFWTGLPRTPRWPRTSRCPASAPSTWPTFRCATSARSCGDAAGDNVQLTLDGSGEEEAALALVRRAPGHPRPRRGARRGPGEARRDPAAARDRAAAGRRAGRDGADRHRGRHRPLRRDVRRRCTAR